MNDSDASEDVRAEMLAMGVRAKKAASLLRDISDNQKRAALRAAAAAIRASTSEILAANRDDMTAAKAAGVTSSVLDRLAANNQRIEGMVAGIEAVASLPDPVGRELARWTRPNGLDITRISTSIGVIGIIYESRPNVTADAAALCLKSGNAVILRGGSEAIRTSTMIHTAFLAGLASCDIPVDATQLVSTADRAAVGLMLNGLDGAIDLLIPRGGKSLVARVQKESRVPILAHMEGLCHVYVHRDADLQKARRVVLNSKMRRTGICGAAETLLIDRAVLRSHGLQILADLQDAGCEIRGDQDVCAIFPVAVRANEQDWRTEYLDAIISVRVVDGLETAVRHVETYGSHHTESIVTENADAANQFLSAVDSAIVLWNASTQFADAGEFGMGAEIGIGTGKLHARGPVSAEQLTTFRYVVRGNGQIRA